MIPDFKTYIGESVWSDIHRRSNGEQVRKEDDVDLMDKEELCDYLKDHYVMLNSPYDIIVDKITDGITVCVYSLKGNKYCYLHLCDFSTYKYVELTDLYNKHMRDLLFGYYSVYEDTDNGNFIISPLKEDDGKITNEFFIEVLDFLLKIADNMHHPCLKKKTSTFESVWFDIHRRSNGLSVRKEDDINIMDKKQFCEYLNKHYDSIYETDIDYSDDDDSIYVCLFEDEAGYNEYLSYVDYMGKNKIYISDTFKLRAESIFKSLEYTFSLKKLNLEDWDRPFVVINPKNIREDINNSFFIRVFDFILERIKSPLKTDIKKI